MHGGSSGTQLALYRRGLIAYSRPSHTPAITPKGVDALRAATFKIGIVAGDILELGRQFTVNREKLRNRVGTAIYEGIRSGAFLTEGDDDDEIANYEAAIDKVMKAFEDKP